MKYGIVLTVLLSFMAALVLSLSQNSWAQIKLSNEEQKVVDYLLKDWKLRFRSTSIPLAMGNLSIEPDDELRLRIGRYFRENIDLAMNLKYWGTNNYILSNDEKLIAKYIIITYDDENRIPAPKELTEAVGIPEERLKSRLAFMAEAGLLVESGSEDLGFSLADGYATWGGPLRYNFHTITIDNGKPFDVW